MLIAGVLYAATTSLIDIFIIMAQIPVACLGGILGLYVTGTPFSVSAAVGFISIFGIAVMDGILLSFYIRQLWQEGHPFREAIVMGSDRRLRATMMTDLVDAFGLLPAALSTRIGAQTQRPLAIVVIGGALAIMLLTRILQPVLIYLCHRRLRLTDAPPQPRATSRFERRGRASKTGARKFAVDLCVCSPRAPRGPASRRAKRAVEDPAMQLETLAHGYGLIEGPRVDERNRLYFSDVPNGGVYRRSPDGGVETLIPRRRGVGGIALNEAGGIVCSGRSLICWDEATRQSRDLFTEWEGRALRGLNDLTVDAAGQRLRRIARVRRTQQRQADSRQRLSCRPAQHGDQAVGGDRSDQRDGLQPGRHVAVSL